MAIEVVSGDTVAICIDLTELRELGMNQYINGKTARKLVQKALKARGEDPWPELEIELFTCEGALLLLARPAKFSNYYFRFANAEELITAACMCPDDLPSQLTYFDGAFFLCVSSTTESIPPALFEFGSTVEDDKNFVHHMAEHGELIIPFNVISVIKQYFD